MSLHDDLRRVYPTCVTVESGASAPIGSNAHARLNRAVWAAYGWADSDPETVDEDTILARLLALNLERNEELLGDPGCERNRA